MCQMVQMDEFVEAILDEWEDQLEVDEVLHAESLTEELPPPEETPEDVHLEFVRAVRRAVADDSDSAAKWPTAYNRWGWRSAP